MTDTPLKIIDLAETHEKCIKAKECVHFLHSNKFIKDKEKQSLTKQILETEIASSVFITKPFRVHEPMQKQLYLLVRSRGDIFIKNLLKTQHEEHLRMEGKNDNQSP